MTQGTAHPAAIVEVGLAAGTRVWAFSHVMSGAEIGEDCNIGEHCFIESGAAIGRWVTIKNGVQIWEGVTLDDGVMVGPNVTFTNDRRPRSPRFPESRKPGARDRDWLVETHIGRGATLGGGTVVVAGVRVGAFAMTAAGAVVTGDVAPYTLVAGVPARPVGRVCACGSALPEDEGEVTCGDCERRFVIDGSGVRERTEASA